MGRIIQAIFSYLNPSSSLSLIGRSSLGLCRSSTPCKAKERVAQGRYLVQYSQSSIALSSARVIISVSAKRRKGGMIKFKLLLFRWEHHDVTPRCSLLFPSWVASFHPLKLHSLGFLATIRLADLADRHTLLYTFFTISF